MIGNINCKQKKKGGSVYTQTLPQKKHEHINQTNKTTEKLEKQNTIRKEGACTRQLYSPITHENQPNQNQSHTTMFIAFP